ncbi:MAG: hypothetical protein K6L80_00480 [Agarilytica sp.]
MKYKELSVRFLGFLLPWVVFSLMQHYILQIQSPYTIMLYGGIAALVSISVRDELLKRLNTTPS